MNPGNVVTPLCFRDGREYIVSLSVNEQPKSFSIVITDKITAEEWSCLYDLKYVEDLTQRAGSYKQFDVFVSMIKGSILKSTDSVTTDLLSVEDLKKLRSKRQRLDLNPTSELSSILTNLGNVSPVSSSSKKKYLIVTYRSEFDNVHYPISLNYSGPPDPLIMQNTIRRLQVEVSHLRSTNVDLLSQLKYHVKTAGNVREQKGSANGENGDSPIPNPGPNAFFSGREYSEQSDIISNQPPIIDVPVKSHSSELGYNIVSMQKLVAAMHKLEERILSERAEHFEQMDKLMSENNFLQKKLEQLLTSETELKERIERLENSLNSNRNTRRQSPRFPRFRQDDLKCTNNFRTREVQQQTSSISNCQFGTVKLPRRDAVTHLILGGRTSSDSAQTSDSHNRAHWGIPSNNNLSKSRFPIPPKLTSGTTIRSRSASPRFDPTAYVKDKKARQEDIQKLRMSRIETRYRSAERQSRRSATLNNVDATSGDERRSRNSSTDRGSSVGSNLGRVRFSESKTTSDLRQRSRVQSKSPIGKRQSGSPISRTTKSPSPLGKRRSGSPRLHTMERAEARVRSRERSLAILNAEAQARSTDRIESGLNIRELSGGRIQGSRSRSQSSPSRTNIAESAANSCIDRELLDTCKKAEWWPGQSGSAKPNATDSQIFSAAGNWHERFANTGVKQRSSFAELEEPLNALQKFIDSTHTRLTQAAEAGRLT